ncbi:hypothetical protein AgCh_009425 [Apium graveolens]
MILLQFGFEKYEVNLSTRPEKFVGSDDIWEKATLALKDALEDKGWNYEIDEGGGAFYGPKVNFNLPQHFAITYVDSDSGKKFPIMIHRAVLGSQERFFRVLIEHYAGDFPLWLSFIQARILPITDMQVSSNELMGVPDSSVAFPLSPLGDACLRNDLTAIHEILEKPGYKDDEGAATELSSQMWTNQVHETINSKKKGDAAFWRKKFQAAVECFTHANQKAKRPDPSQRRLFPAQN